MRRKKDKDVISHICLMFMSELEGSIRGNVQNYITKYSTARWLNLGKVQREAIEKFSQEGLNPYILSVKDKMEEILGLKEE